MKERTGAVVVALSHKNRHIAAVHRAYPHAEIRLCPHLVLDYETLDPVDMKGAEILLCEVPPANFADFDQLKWIQISSSGYAQVLNLHLLEHGIRVTRGLGNFDVPIAEWNIMMMIMWQRHAIELLKNQRNCHWDRDPKFSGELRGSVIGFYGYGGLARETARIAKTMGATVWALCRGGKATTRDMTYRVSGTGDPVGILPDRIFGEDEKEEFLNRVDFLILGLTLTPTTTGIIGERELRMLKPDAVLLNPARAQLIDEEVFVRCMSEGWIKGASLDVHYTYPLPVDHPLWSMENLILTPHISGSGETEQFLERIFDIFIQNLRLYSAGARMINELTEAQLRGE